MKRTLPIFLLLFAGLSLSTVTALADTIKLKNGSVIKGKVTTYNDREFTVSLDLGSSTKRSNSRMVIAVEDIESIQFDGAEMASNGSASTPSEGSTRPTYKEPAPQPTSTPAPATMTNKPAESGEAPAFEKSVGVVAAADWTSTEIMVKKGQRVVISASGQIELGSSRRSGPEGTNIPDPKKLMPERPTGALIAVIGDDNDDFIPIGSGTEFVAERNGILFLSVNEGNLRDNNGSFAAKIKVFGK